MQKSENILITSEAYQKLYAQILASRTLNPAQKEILDAFFEQGAGRIFLRIGRKGSKTASLIMTSWLFAYFRPRSMTHFLYPTLEQGYDVLWEEERIQLCDLKDHSLQDEWVKDIDDKKMTIVFNNDSKIRVLGTWAQKRGRGVQPDLMIADEIQDTNPAYLLAADPNLMAKPDARFILSGTPPKQRNHYHEWEQRTLSLYGGKHFHYSSYINTSLPHLAGELDKKKAELIAAGKEDEWIREYLAEDCFSSEDRILPDPKFQKSELLITDLRQVHHTHRTHIIGMHITETTICAVIAIMEKSSSEANKIYILDYILKGKLWDGTYREVYNQLPVMCESVTSVPFTQWRKWVTDQTNSFIDVIPGFTKSREDKGSKWIDRGFPLMREMMHMDRLIFADRLEPVTLEMQNLLKGDDFNKYPICSTIAMIVSEHYQESRRKPSTLREFSDTEKVCEMLNLRPPERKSRGVSFIRHNWHH
jgi:hypothetical protein